MNVSSIILLLTLIGHNTVFMSPVSLVFHTLNLSIHAFNFINYKQLQ